jgi:hypothetical protein
MRCALAIAVFLCAATCVAADAAVKPTPELLDKIFSASNTASPAAIRAAMDAVESARKTIASIQTSVVNPQVRPNRLTGGWSGSTYVNGQLMYASAEAKKTDLASWTNIHSAAEKRLSDLRQKLVVAYPVLKPPFSVGQFGEFQSVPTITQIIGDTDATYSLNDTSFWIRGLSTKGLTADDEVPISGPLVATGTNLVNGKTIMVFEPLDDAFVQSQYKQALDAKKAPGR